MNRKLKRRVAKRRAITRRPARRPSNRVVKPATLAPVVYKGGQPVRLDEKQVELIKSLCAKESTPEEFELFMQICKKSKLDPFKKEIYFVKFNTKRGAQMVIITGIDGFRAMAARDHKDFGGTSAAEFTYPEAKLMTPAGRLIPLTATVKAYRKGGVECTATVYWEEFAPVDLKHPRSDFWNRMPKVMLEKCAEAKALRKAFPGLGNIFTSAEMDQQFQDQTEEGRQISRNGVAPSGAVVDARLVANQEREAIVERKLTELAPHGHLPGTQQAKNAEEALRRVEEEDRKLAEARNVTPPAQKPIPAQKPSAAAPQASLPQGITMVRGTFHKVVGAVGKNNAEFRDIQIGQQHFKCFVKPLFKYLDQYGQMGGFTINAMVDKRMTIIGLSRVGPVTFEQDGRTEVVREAGQEG